MESPYVAPCWNDHCRDKRGDRQQLIFSVSKKRFLSLPDFPPPWEEQPKGRHSLLLGLAQLAAWPLLGGQSWKWPVAQHGIGLLLLQQPAWETLSCCLQA